MMFTEVGMAKIYASFKGYEFISLKSFAKQNEADSIRFEYNENPNYFWELRKDGHNLAIAYCPNGIHIKAIGFTARTLDEAIKLLTGWLKSINEIVYTSGLNHEDEETELINKKVMKLLGGIKLNEEKFDIDEIANMKVRLEEIKSDIINMMIEKERFKEDTDKAIEELNKQLDFLKKILVKSTKKEWINKYLSMLVTFSTNENYRKLFGNVVDIAKEGLDQVLGQSNLLN